MQYNQLGDSNLKVSNICLGTMTFGQQNTEQEAHQQLDYAVDQGINFVDTAEMYPVPPRAETAYSTENIVGSWIHKNNRKKIVLATKAAGSARGMPWVRKGEHAFNRVNLRNALEGSLKRLKTDYIDLYQLHWPERNTPMFGQYLFDPEQEREYTAFTETLEALDELIKEGKIRHIGLSNEWPWGLMQFLNASERDSLPRVVSVQNAYNLINRTYDSSLREMGYRENVPLLAYSPMAFGHLSAKYINDSQAQGRVNIFDGFAQRYEKPGVEPAVHAYADLAQELQVSPATLALAFTYSRWFCASTIIGATNMDQLKENVNAVNFEWNSEIEDAVEAINLRFFNPAP
ncbi:MAG: aldo/keto reductase [Gammaproteobacteria bacterium]|nr:MAG: aldo/keto reductase [Gammaproteobacteria bacterium]